MVRIIALIFWVVPVGLICLSINQGLVAGQLRNTWNNGELAIAKVDKFETTNRADVTYGYINLRVELSNGELIERKKMSLPQSLWPRVKGQDSLRVYVKRETAQEIVIDDLMPAHWLIAVSQMGISLFGALLSGVFAFLWNRSLRQKQD